MTKSTLSASQVDQLQAFFGERLKRDVNLGRFTSSRLGGPADNLISSRDARQLADDGAFLWEQDIPTFILGAGSNILISDAGIRQVVILNRAKAVKFQEHTEHGPMVRAESGASLGLLARRAVSRGWSGLEWAAGIPGTVGGAVVGNAGAHGGNMAGNLILAEILHRKEHIVRRVEWAAEDFAFDYRSSRIKGSADDYLVLRADLGLSSSSPKAVRAKMQEFGEHRKQTQPPGASVGSMFKNPPGDYAGRLIEQAGLKGYRIGDAEISEVHANFFINRGEASAADVRELIQTARERVAEQFGVRLELEILLIGDWNKDDADGR